MSVFPDTDENFVAAVFEHVKRDLEYLADRWADESEYEDIEEYRAYIEKRLPEGVVVSAMTKRPLGFKFEFAGSLYHFYANRRAVGYNVKALKQIVH